MCFAAGAALCGMDVRWDSFGRLSGRLSRSGQEMHYASWGVVKIGRFFSHGTLFAA